MATTLENLIAAKEAWAAGLVNFAGRPSYVDGAGQSFDFDSYMKRGADLDAMIAAAQGPVVIETQGTI